jgi:hypothetical protein
MMRTSMLFWILGVLFMASCRLNDNNAPLPFYLELSDPSVVSPLGGGYDSHKITDAWVFADGQILGVFPLPARVPVVVSGQDVEITILAGIRNNGMQDTPVFYPFYKSIVTKIAPVANGSITIPLTFQYVSNAKIPVNEGFENGSTFSIDIDGNPESSILVSGDVASLGKKSGLVQLTNSLKFMEAASVVRILDGQNARGKSYIELDYKGEGEIAVGIAKLRAGVFRVDYVLFVPGKTDWNKIYVDVTDKLSPRDYDEYRLVFGFSRTGVSETSRLYVDNIKHLHF